MQGDLTNKSESSENNLRPKKGRKIAQAYAD